MHYFQHKGFWEINALFSGIKGAQTPLGGGGGGGVGGGLKDRTSSSLLIVYALGNIKLSHTGNQK